MFHTKAVVLFQLTGNKDGNIYRFMRGSLKIDSNYDSQVRKDGGEKDGEVNN